MASLSELRAEREKFKSTRGSLYIAIEKANNLKSRIINAASSFSAGIKGAGKDLDESKFDEHSENMSDIAKKLSTIANYCTQQIEILNNKISEEEARLAAQNPVPPKGGNDNSKPSTPKRPNDKGFYVVTAD